MLNSYMYTSLYENKKIVLHYHYHVKIQYLYVINKYFLRIHKNDITKYKIPRLVHIIFYILSKYKFVLFITYIHLFTLYSTNFQISNKRQWCFVCNQNYFSTVSIILLHNSAVVITI